MIKLGYNPERRKGSKIPGKRSSDTGRKHHRHTGTEAKNQVLAQPAKGLDKGEQFVVMKDKGITAGNQYFINPGIFFHISCHTVREFAVITPDSLPCYKPSETMPAIDSTLPGYPEKHPVMITMHQRGDWFILLFKKGIRIFIFPFSHLRTGTGQ
jgi:hypothetical protein